MLAGYAGLSREMVRKLEQGVRQSARISTLKALAQALNVPLRVLLGDDSPVTEPAGGLARQAEVTKPAQPAGEPARPTLLRALITERHWQRFRTFETQFRRAARELAERERDPGLAKLTVSSRQWERWYAGNLKTEPHPDACRVLEHMFGYPIQQLLTAGEVENNEPQAVPAFPATGQNPSPQSSPAIIELCAVLTDYGFRLNQFTSPLRDGIPSSKNLERELEIVFNTYQQSRFTAASSRISMLLADTQVAIGECKDSERARLLRILALSYQAAASILSKTGQPDISWIAAERGLRAAEASGIPEIRASLIRSVAYSLLSTGRLESAISLVESGAGNLEKEITGDNRGLSVYGTLFLVGSMAAARFGDGPKTAEYLREAGNAANRIGRDANHLWTAFGPTNVAIHRVNTAVELGDIQKALDHGLSLNTGAMPMERRARYLLDVARAYSLTRNREDSLGALLTAERLAPEQVRQHYLTRKVINILMRNMPGKPSIELDKLAARVNVRETT
jgi:transcriptional regulator with XRE-family HTH domain